MSLYGFTQMIKDVKVNIIKIEPWKSQNILTQTLKQHIQHAVQFEQCQRRSCHNTFNFEYDLVPRVSILCPTCNESVNWGFNRPVTYYPCKHIVCLSCAHETNGTRPAFSDMSLHCTLCRQSVQTLEIMYRETLNTKHMETHDATATAILPPLDDSDSDIC